MHKSSWNLRTLGEACEINPPRPSLQGLSDDVKVLFLPMAGIDEATGTVVAGEERALGMVRNKSFRTFAPGDVLFAKITPCMENGKAAIVPAIPSGLGFGSTEFHVLRARAGVNNEFIWHYVRQKWFRQEAEHHMAGSVGQLRVPTSFLEHTPIMVPAEEVQEAVVGVLNVAAAKQGSAGNHLAEARRTLQLFRRAVLSDACTGELTKGWRSSHDGGETAQDLVGRIGERRRGKIEHRGTSGDFAPRFGLPKSWCWVPVGSLVDVATGATPLRSRSDYYGGPIPWVTSGAVNAGWITEPSDWITELAVKETNAKVFPPGTLLVAMYGEGQTRGRVAELGVEAATNQAVAALLFDEVSATIRPYLRMFFLENYERMRSESFGGVQPNLSLSAIKEILVPLPPLAEQREALRVAGRCLDAADSLLRHMAETEATIELSSQALIGKAFRGELVLPIEGEWERCVATS